jgi:sugar/nucleoside kinase (ribokinase family)
VERKLLTRLESGVGAYDLVLVVDQAETDHGGVVTPAMRRLLRDMATRNPEKVFWVDSRRRLDLFRRVIVKVNRDEAEDACRRLFGPVDYQRLRQQLETRLLLVTNGSAGVTVVQPGEQTQVEARRIMNPVDICGAGDSFSAGAALALAVSGSPVDAARVGNLVASITIMKRGTGTATPEEVLAAETAGV